MGKLLFAQGKMSKYKGRECETLEEVVMEVKNRERHGRAGRWTVSETDSQRNCVEVFSIDHFVARVLGSVDFMSWSFVNHECAEVTILPALVMWLTARFHGDPRRKMEYGNLVQVRRKRGKTLINFVSQ